MTSRSFETPVTRYYVDIRPYVAANSDIKLKAVTKKEVLPLLKTLPKETQDKITRYHKASDRFMSLASALLKHLFVHRAAKIPWKQVEISKTPKPHLRPYWQPIPEWQMNEVGGLEFNVSHQAGVVLLVGCYTPKRVDSNDAVKINPDPTGVLEVVSEIDEDEYDEVRIGVDIACTNESSQTANAETQNDVNEWVDIFGEMFSRKEILNMKFGANPDHVEDEIKAKIRRFFTYWSLKEAYIKMVGEGLLADWLRELEFENVVAPCESSGWSTENGNPNIELKTIFRNKDITQTMRTNLEGFEDNFIIATMFRGVKEKHPQQSAWEAIDFENHVRPCAEGRCLCIP